MSNGKMYYGKDLRIKVIEYAKNKTEKEASEVFGVGTRTISRWKKLLRENGNLERVPFDRKARKLDMEELRRYVEKYPDAYLKEMAKEFAVSIGCVYKALGRMKITLKKRRNPTKSGKRNNVRTAKGQYLPSKKGT
jgi:transposase